MIRNNKALDHTLWVYWLNDSRGMLEKEDKLVNRELKVSDLKISQMGLLM